MNKDDKINLTYFPGVSELAHIVSELEKYINHPKKSSLKFDFEIKHFLKNWGIKSIQWVYSYSQNCITLKMVHSNGVALKQLSLHSPYNIVLMDDIQLFSLSDTMLRKLTSDNFDNVEICHYLLEKVNGRLKNILSSPTGMDYRLKYNYISLKQIQNGDLSQSDLNKLENEIVEYLSKIFVVDPVRLHFTPEIIIPLKIADLKTVFPNFEEKLTDKIASSILGVNVNNCKNLKTSYKLSDDFLKLCLRNYSNKITSKSN